MEDGPGAVPREVGRVPRGGARDALVLAAADLLAEATLDDLTAFITVSRLKERTGLSSGAIYSAFSPTTGVGARTRSAPQAVARRAVLDPPDDSDDLYTAAVGDLLEGLVAGAEAGDDGVLVDAIADRVAEMVMVGARGDLAAGYTLAWIAIAVSLQDPEVAAYLRGAYGTYAGRYAALVERLLAISGREPADGLDVLTLATLVMSTVDGAAMMVRFDDGLDERFISKAIVACWAGATRRAGVTDELLGHRIAVPTSAPAQGDELRAVEAAVRRVRDRAGWPAVTLHKVAQLAGVSDSRMAGLFATRDHLAPLVWDATVDTLERRSVARGPLGADELVVEFVRDVADAACSERALVASLLVARLQSVDLDPEHTRPRDPSARLAGHLARLLRPGEGDRPDEDGSAFQAAAQAVDGLLLRAASSSVPAEDLAAAVLADVAPRPVRDRT